MCYQTIMIQLCIIVARFGCTLIIDLFIRSSYVKVTEETSESLSGRYCNRVDRLVVYYEQWWRVKVAVGGLAPVIFAIAWC